MTVQQIETFKRENELTPDAPDAETPAGVDFDDEIDLRAEDDALIAAELEAEQAKAAEEAAAAAEAEPDDDEEDGEDGEGKKPARRRGRRGRGRRPAKSSGALEGTFDHGEEGYGLWLDPAVEDDPVYAEHWAGHRPVEVTIEADRIVIRRAASGDGGDSGEDDE
ncbi:MAG TPA: hypothetical protein VIL49_10510 [Capillimicrobium sp.]